MNNKKRYQVAISKISIPSSLEKQILTQTIDQKKKKTMRLVPILLLCFLVFTLTITTVYGREIKEWIQKWSATLPFEKKEAIIFGEGKLKKIPSDVIKTDPRDGLVSLSIEELEAMLQFPVLKRRGLPQTVGYLSSLNEDDTIGRIDLLYSNFANYSENRFITLSASFLCEGADPGYIMAFEEGIDATAGKEREDTYYMEGLKTVVLFYKNDWSEERMNATFVYDDVLYKLMGMNVSKDEMIEVIDELTIER